MTNNILLKVELGCHMRSDLNHRRSGLSHTRSSKMAAKHNGVQFLLQVSIFNGSATVVSVSTIQDA